MPSQSRFLMTSEVRSFLSWLNVARNGSGTSSFFTANGFVREVCRNVPGAPRTMDDLFCQELIVLTVIGMLIAQDADRAKPATADADDLIALAQGANGDGSDCGIQPRHIPAAGQNTDYALLGGDVGHTPFNFEGFRT